MLVCPAVWNVDFIREWYPRTGFLSMFRLREFLINERRAPDELMSLTFRRPLRGKVLLRKRGSDPATLMEIVRDEVYRGVVDTVPQVRTVIDLGANIGLASLYFATQYEGCRIVAVEPHPETFALLQRNLAPLVTRGQAKLINAAVWSSKSPLTGNWTDRYSGFAVHDTPGTLSGIAGITMHDIIEQSGFASVDLLKMDIEGAETELFRELSWLSRVNAIAIEFHDDTRENTRFDSLMQEHGFRVVESKHTVLAIRKPSRET